MRPDFIIGGIMKSGTTYLDNLVRSHPDIRMPQRLMAYSFFDNDEIYKRGFDWYQSIFENLDASGNKVVGQTSADCAFNNGSITRIKQHLPSAKLVFILRHPVQRAYSLYWHQVMMGREYHTFEDAIKLEEKRMTKSYYHYKMYSYLERSRYKQQFDYIYQNYDKKKILLIPFEALIKDEIKYLNKVFSFVGVTPIQSMNELQVQGISKNPARIPTTMHAVRLSSFLQEFGMVRLGRFILNRFLEYKRPPAINPKTDEFLQEILKDDIAFHQSVLDSFN